jgi:SOS response regulatory protein OraA/RecX
MKQSINEIKKMQHLAGIITENEESNTIMTAGGDKLLKIAQSLVNKGYDLEDIMTLLKKHIKF